MDLLIDLLTPRPKLLPTTPIRWESLFKKAKAHEVFPLFYEAIKKHPHWSSTIPPPLKEEMNILYYQHTARNVLLLNRLKKIATAFKNANISFVLFKGFDLALRIYGDSLLRTQRDLDFIVAPKDFAKARQVLMEIGENAFLDLHQDIVSLKRFEHWSPPPLTIEGFWNRCETVSWDGINIPVLNREDLFLALAIHFVFHHHLRGLKWLMDFAWLVEKQGLNWPSLMDHAKANHLSLILFSVLKRLQQVFPIPLPENFLLNLSAKNKSLFL